MVAVSIFLKTLQKKNIMLTKAKNVILIIRRVVIILKVDLFFKFVYTN